MDATDEDSNSRNGSAENGYDRQDIRLAVVLNGGVSLAVWMSGVTLELHRLAMARHREQAPYQPLLDLLQADARVDVIAGTSAGGINGAFLALGLAQDRDIDRLRDLWRDHGSLELLLRSPLDKDPPSLLQGDGYFLPTLKTALTGILAAEPAGDGVGHPVELILTGTLWEGRTTPFTDDLGARITEVDHDALFRFAKPVDGRPGVADLSDKDIVTKLAAAARCTSSFPGAFEPHWVEVDGSPTTGDGPWPSAAGGANFRQSQYVLDGGVLLNKPIRPALEAVYRQTAGIQVRRVLAYVVPDPSGPVVLPAKENLPHARDAVLGVFTRLRSTDSVSRELAEIRTNNEAVRLRRQVRDRLAAAMTDAAQELSEQAWSGYVDVRVDHAARIIGGLIAAGQAEGEKAWSRLELVEVVQGVLRRRRGKDGSFIPADTLDAALKRTGEQWDWGVTTVERLADMAVDVLRRAVRLAPMGRPERAEIIEARRRLRPALEGIRAKRRELDEYWAGSAATAMPGRIAQGSGEATNKRELETWLEGVVKCGSREYDPGWPYKTAREIAGVLRACAPAVADVAGIRRPVESDHLDSRRLSDLHDYLFGSAGGPRFTRGLLRHRLPSEHGVLQRMLRLDVVQLAFSGASQDVEQEVELVQFSSTDPHLLTGTQLHHFGAFYRPSWRVNDWLRGRVDGAEHIVRMLLSSDRLRQRAAVVVDSRSTSAAQIDAKRGQRVGQLLEEIHRCATYPGPESPDGGWLETEWAKYRGQCEKYLRSIVTEVHVGPSRWKRSAQDASRTGRDGAAVDLDGLQACIKVISQAIRADILRQDLDTLATAISGEPGNDRTPGERSWLSSYEERKKDAAGDDLPAEALLDLWEEADRIGKELISHDVGSDTFARTLSQTAAVAVSTATAQNPASVIGFRQVKPVHMVLAALRGYTLTVWGMVTFLTRRSWFAANAVNLALAVGGVLLASALFVPGLPTAFPVAGAFLLLAGASASALLIRPPQKPAPGSDGGKTPADNGRTSEGYEKTKLLARGAHRVGWRLATIAVLALGVAAYLAWDSVKGHVAGAVLSGLFRIGVGLLVVLVGWWVSRAQRWERKQEPKQKYPEPRPEAVAADDGHQAEQAEARAATAPREAADGAASGDRS
ncbi:patatin-like protein [Kitasatospora sp. NPDC056531]|uniref:patatin-like protein n=1 Tax=Kitasatospora sp. NPDC056531 TaxID=3345856 RepID=UPI0036A59874